MTDCLPIFIINCSIRLTEKQWSRIIFLCLKTQSCGNNEPKVVPNFKTLYYTMFMKVNVSKCLYTSSCSTDFFDIRPIVLCFV